MREKRVRARKFKNELKSLFLNRELGWLEFNDRVLDLAKSKDVPLLEKVRFLTIVNSNLDEFFMKRVGGLKRAIAGEIFYRSSDGMTPQEELLFIRRRVLLMIREQGRVFNKVLKPALRKEGIFLKRWRELSSHDRKYLTEYFYSMISPVLTPLVVDPAHPFPHISNLSTSLGVRLENPLDKTVHFARVKVPEMLDQWVELKPKRDGSRTFVSLVEIIQENLADLFPGMKIISVTPFRITRNIELGKDLDDVEDILEHVTQELLQRKFAEVVRLEHGPNYDQETINILKKELAIQDEDIYQVLEPWDIDYCGLRTFYKLNYPELKYPEFRPTVPPAFLVDEAEELFSRIRREDILIHHPYESFTQTIVKWIELAIRDPKVLTIKITLYRTEEDSPIIAALKQALEYGKQVVVLIELQARLDERRNILWARELERVGAHVCYGIVGLKIHTKLCLIVRKEDDTVRCYAHIGSGNYNSVTASAYTDVSLITAKEEITSEVREVFNFLTGLSNKKDYHYLMVSPLNLANRLQELIEREIEHKKKGRPALVIAKMNNFEESSITRKLYEASSAGVTIHLLVRGFCCLRPQKKGLSENIWVRSILGRFLEHSRIYYFRNGMEDPRDGDFFIGSADWMYRNLYGRVECLAPILDRHLKAELWGILQIMLDDQLEHWNMASDGKYVKISQGKYEHTVHRALIERYQERERIYLESFEER
ncbi:MAG: polyphosphate kinase 1 [Bdellovibrionaceae bacterium]|nr:polyphosphate kinase 1 [Pseudobdellovibrionaceae bacterium]MDW8189656.1 polyphosphate kinase 1 [Pseudobdellovibrionaceae bacterium]